MVPRLAAPPSPVATRRAGASWRLRGDLLRPDDPRYDAARRVYNGMQHRNPALVVGASDVADVRAAVTFAAEHDALPSVRGGGHSVPGHGTCDGGVVLDLGRMRGIRVDPQRRMARVDSGSAWGDLDHATHAFGLATTGGIVTTTGVVGLTLGGGFEHLARRWGLSCDNLLAADVVTADGRFLACNEAQEPDLFWALRGGSGNFGMVASFAFRLHPPSEILGGPVFFRPDPEVLRRDRDFIAGGPEEPGLVFAHAQAPPAPFLPPEGSAFACRDARFATVVSGTWAQPADGGRTIGWVRDYHDGPRSYSEEGGRGRDVRGGAHLARRCSCCGPARRWAHLRHDPGRRSRDSARRHRRKDRPRTERSP